jgi:paraquat-inducible protein B
VEPTGNELRATLAEAKKAIQTFDATAVEARRFITTHAGLGGELTGTLASLAETLDAIKQLVDFLERNPNALITGRKKPQ